MRVRGEDGQVLGIALAFLAFVAVLLGVTLMGATSQLHATQNLTQIRDDQYAAEASVYAAAKTMQGDVAMGADRGTSSTSCDFGPTPAFVVNDVEPSVACSPHAGSGVGDGNDADAAPNRPSYAVLALPSSGDEGVINLNEGDGQPCSPGQCQVNIFGPVRSNGGQCQIAAVACDTSPVQDPGVNPNTAAGYTPTLLTAPPSHSAPGCVNGQATFSPGTYHSLPVACPLLLFTAGAYYFDFTSPGLHTWTIPSGETVIGGTPDTRAGAPPGACLTDHALGSNGGVQFVFGGDSGMHVGSGANVHLCAQESTTSQEIAVYGVARPTVPLQSNDQSPRQSQSPDSSYMPRTSNATVDGNDQHASILAGQTASLAITRFRPLPPQSIVESATLELTHGEDPAMQSLTLNVRDGARTLASFASSSDPACVTNNQLCIGSTDHSDSLDVTSIFRDPTTSFFNQSALSNLNLAYTATAPAGTGSYSSSVDGVVLHVMYTPAHGWLPAADRMHPGPATWRLPGAVDGSRRDPRGRRHRLCADRDRPGGGHGQPGRFQSWCDRAYCCVPVGRKCAVCYGGRRIRSECHSHREREWGAAGDHVGDLRRRGCLSERAIQRIHPSPTTHGTSIDRGLERAGFSCRRAISCTQLNRSDSIAVKGEKGRPMREIIQEPAARDGGGDAGFTLIELLVVIVILAILAAIVVFAVGGITNKGQTSACDTDMKTIQTAEEAYYGSQTTGPLYGDGTDASQRGFPHGGSQ